MAAMKTTVAKTCQSRGSTCPDHESCDGTNYPTYDSVGSRVDDPPAVPLAAIGIELVSNVVENSSSDSFFSLRQSPPVEFVGAARRHL